MIPFHPCGQVVDLLRHCYKSKMRLWQDDPTETEIRWFRAPPGAKILDGVSVLRSWQTWLRGEENTSGIGEVTGISYPYDKGANPVGYTGQHQCGEKKVFERGGIHNQDPEIETEANGSAACCQVPVPPPETPAFVGCQNLQQGGPVSDIFYLGLNTAGRSAWIFWSQTRPAPFALQTIPGYDLVHTATSFVNVFGADQYVTMSVYYRDLDGSESDPTTFTLVAGTTGGGTLVVFEDPSTLENAGVGAATDISLPTTSLPSPVIAAGPNAQVITHIMRNALTITFESRDFTNSICPYSTNALGYRGFIDQVEQEEEGATPVLTESIVCLAGFGCAATYAIAGVP